MDEPGFFPWFPGWSLGKQINCIISGLALAKKLPGKCSGLGI
jgi:hypothetical protein